MRHHRGELTIHGDGEQTRDFVHSEDLSAAVIAALDAPEADVAGEVFNVGTGRETTVNELAAAVGAGVGVGIGCVAGGAGVIVVSPVPQQNPTGPPPLSALTSAIWSVWIPVSPWVSKVGTASAV